MRFLYGIFTSIYRYTPLPSAVKTKLKKFIWFAIPSLSKPEPLPPIVDEVAREVEFSQYLLIRKARLLQHIFPKTQDGLEVGPLFSPIITKIESAGHIQYVDYLTTDELKEEHKNDPKVQVDEIVNVDYVCGDSQLTEIVNGRLFDYVLASHVIEHVPDMLGWLREIADVLKDNGVLSLAIPDKRYTYDVLRETTSAGTLIEAYLLKKRRPSPCEIFDEFELVVKVDKYDAWNNSLNKMDLERYHTLQSGFIAAQESLLPGKYINVHCTVVTPASFLHLLEVACRLGLFDFFVQDFYDTFKNQLEFIVILKRVPRSVDQDEKIVRQLESIEQARRLIT